jgi:hypothetical protein
MLFLALILAAVNQKLDRPLTLTKGAQKCFALRVSTLASEVVSSPLYLDRGVDYSLSRLVRANLPCGSGGETEYCRTRGASTPRRMLMLEPAVGQWHPRRTPAHIVQSRYTRRSQVRCHTSCRRSDDSGSTTRSLQACPGCSGMRREQYQSGCQ